MNTKPHPRIGVGVIIIRDKKVLLGKRRNSHGDGSWCFPGGHLEFGESLEECARREVLEETGLQIANVRSGPYTNDVFSREEKHYVTIFMLADWQEGEAALLEPEKCEEWQWFSWDSLPKPLFLPTENLLRQKYNPFEDDK